MNPQRLYADFFSLLFCLDFCVIIFSPSNLMKFSFGMQYANQPGFRMVYTEDVSLGLLLRVKNL